MKRTRFLTIALLVLFVFIPLRVHAASLISKLEVEGIGDLSLARNSWNLQLTTSLTYANIIATPANETVTIEGAGKVEVNEGQNQIVVKATSGETTETYTINLNVIKSTGNVATGTDVKVVDANGTDVKNPNTGSFVSLTIIMILIGSLILIAVNNRNKKKVFSLR